MDIREIASRCEPENRHLVYEPDASDIPAIVESLVGMANSEGGTVVVGAEVDEGGTPVRFTDVSTRDTIAARIERELLLTVEPTLSCRTDQFRVGGARFVAFTVSPSNQLRSVQNAQAEKPAFPTYTGMGLSYLSGRDIDNLLELSAASSN